MRNYSMDSLKLICAILVMCIHTPQIENMVDYIAPLYRCAVPIFFMISGYFTYGKKNLDSTIRRRIIDQLKIFCWALIFYFIVALFNKGLGAFSILGSLMTTGCLLGNYVTYAEHLWYILAYVYVLLVMLLVERYNMYKFLFCITPVLLIIAVIAGTYSEMLFGHSYSLYYTRNFLFTGLPFFALGMIAKRMKSISVPAMIASCMIFYATGLLEVKSFEFSTGDIYISTIFLSISIFLLFVNIRQTKDNFISRTGREDGLYIYIFHFFVAISVPYDDRFLYASVPVVLCLTLLFIAILRKTRVIGRVI